MKWIGGNPAIGLHVEFMERKVMTDGHIQEREIENNFYLETMQL